MRIVQPSSPCRSEVGDLSHFTSNRVPHTTLLSPEPSDLTPIHHPPQGRGLLVVIPGGGFFWLLGTFDSVVVVLSFFFGLIPFLSPVL